MHKIIFIVFLLPCALVAQPNNTPRNWVDSVLYEIIDSSIYVLRVEYVLRGTSSTGQQEDFGRNKKLYFGRNFDVAIAADDRIWVNAKMLEPWKYADQDAYNKIVSTSQEMRAYKPVVSKISLRRKFDPAFLDYPVGNLPAKLPQGKELIDLPLPAFTQKSQTLANRKEELAQRGFACMVKVNKGWNFRENDPFWLEISPQRIKNIFQEFNSENTPNDMTIGGAYLLFDKATGYADCYFGAILEQVTDQRWKPLMAPTQQEVEDLKPTKIKEAPGNIPTVNALKPERDSLAQDSIRSRQHPEVQPVPTYKVPNATVPNNPTNPSTNQVKPGNISHQNTPKPSTTMSDKGIKPENTANKEPENEDKKDKEHQNRIRLRNPFSKKDH